MKLGDTWKNLNPWSNITPHDPQAREWYKRRHEMHTLTDEDHARLDKVRETAQLDFEARRKALAATATAAATTTTNTKNTSAVWTPAAKPATMKELFIRRARNPHDYRHPDDPHGYEQKTEPIYVNREQYNAWVDATYTAPAWKTERELCVGSYHGDANDAAITAHAAYKAAKKTSRVYNLLTSGDLHQYDERFAPPTLLDGNRAQHEIRLGDSRRVTREDAHAEMFAAKAVRGFQRYQPEKYDAHNIGVDYEDTDETIESEDWKSGTADRQAARDYARRQYHVEPDPDTAADKKSKHRSNGLTYHPLYIESALYGSLSDKDGERLREYTRRVNEGLPTTDADRQWYADLTKRIPELWIDANNPMTSAPIDWDNATDDQRKNENRRRKRDGMPSLSRKVKEKPIRLLPPRNALSGYAAIAHN